MPDDPTKPPAPTEWVEIIVPVIRGRYVPMTQGVVISVPNRPEALESAWRSIYWSVGAWLN